MYPEVYANIYVKVGEGTSSFWYDKWLNNDPIAACTTVIRHPNLQFKTVGMVKDGILTF